MPSSKKTSAATEPANPAAASDTATPKASVQKPAAGTKPVAKFRMRVTMGDVIAIGPGKIQLLEAIGETGSITSAAKSLDMSYRRAWLLLDELNQALRKPAVDSAKGGQNGGGSLVTENGRQLIALYRQVEATAAAACKPELTRLIGMLTR